MNRISAHVIGPDQVLDPVVSEIVASVCPTPRPPNFPVPPHKRTHLRRTEVMRRMREARIPLQPPFLDWRGDRAAQHDRVALCAACCPAVAVFPPPAPPAHSALPGGL